MVRDRTNERGFRGAVEAALCRAAWCSSRGTTQMVGISAPVAAPASSSGAIKLAAVGRPAGTPHLQSGQKEPSTYLLQLDEPRPQTATVLFALKKSYDHTKGRELLP